MHGEKHHTNKVYHQVHSRELFITHMFTQINLWATLISLNIWMRFH